MNREEIVSIIVGVLAQLDSECTMEEAAEDIMVALENIKVVHSEEDLN